MAKNKKQSFKQKHTLKKSQGILNVNNYLKFIIVSQF